MVDHGERKSTRLDTISKAVSIAVSALSAGMILYGQYLAMRRESRDDALHAELDKIKAQLLAQKAERLDPGTQESLARQILDVRQKVRHNLSAGDLDNELRRAQDALESLAMPSSRFDASSSSGPRDSSFHRNSASGGYPKWAEDDYPPPPPPQGARYYPPPPPPHHHYYQSTSPPPPPHGTTHYSPPQPGHQYGSGSRGYPARGNQRGPQSYKPPNRNNTHDGPWRD